MHFVQEDIEIQGDVFEEREIPSDVALITPLVVRLIERLEEEKLVDDSNRMKVELCLDEAITNSVRHGNQSEFDKLVKVSLFRSPEKWGIVICDQGKGFSSEDLPKDRTSGDEIWAENGRGLPLLALYMDEVVYYRNGRTLLLSQFL